jgi:hypothetical protein
MHLIMEIYGHFWALFEIFGEKTRELFGGILKYHILSYLYIIGPNLI